MHIDCWSDPFRRKLIVITNLGITNCMCCREAQWPSGLVKVQKVGVRCAFEDGLRYATTGKLF